MSLFGKKQVCSTCGMKFSSKEELRQHSAAHMAPRPQQAQALSCPTCGASFSRPEELRTHVQQRHSM